MQLPVRAIWVFHTAARVGSISRAAEELSVTPSAVTQQIQSLELQLGVSLLAKVGRRIVLTEAGERYFSTITERDGTHRGGDRHDPRIPFGHHAGGARDADAVEQMAAAAPVAFSTPIRTWRCAWTGPTSPRTSTANSSILKFGTATATGPACSSRACRRKPSFRPALRPGAAGSLDAADLPRFRLIHSVKSQAQWSRWFALAGVQPQERWRRVLFDRSHMAIDAAVDGMGIALESTMMMERELSAGALVCPVAHPPSASARHAMDRLSARSPAPQEGPDLPRLAAGRARGRARRANISGSRPQRPDRRSVAVSIRSASRRSVHQSSTAGSSVANWLAEQRRPAKWSLRWPSRCSISPNGPSRKANVTSPSCWRRKSR